MSNRTFRPNLSKENVKLIRKWVRALRSGKYKQGRGALRPVADQFCCLGVLCDVVAPNGWQPSATRASINHHGVGGVPSGVVQAAAGLFTCDFLVTLNDRGRGSDLAGKRRRVTFRGIASYIEKELAKATA